jgi:hypothetical protein
MQIRKRKTKEDLLSEYDRGMLRSAFVGLFWTVISYRKRRGIFQLRTLSDKIGVNKSAPSRWFSGARPNWTVNTIADIADALDVEIEIRARDRKTGVIFAPHGIVSSKVQTAAPDRPIEISGRPNRPYTESPDRPTELVA